MSAKMQQMSYSTNIWGSKPMQKRSEDKRHWYVDDEEHQSGDKWTSGEEKTNKT